MNIISSFEELKGYRIYNYHQHWYYVILFNPRDITQAGQAVIDNFNIFHIDSGEECQYFIPGFKNSGMGLFFERFFDLSGDLRMEIPGFGRVSFSDRDFVEFYKKLEELKAVAGWRYSGECELLLFNINEANEIALDDFYSYNLDDIVRNGRKVSEFIRATINAGKDAETRKKAKRLLDEKYYEMIMPDGGNCDTERYEKSWRLLENIGFKDDSYLFISYSTKDSGIVNQIYKNLRSAGINCWMAPYDIPGGTNYAWVIEHAIKHANKFILMLSEAAVESVWVGKELKRAITRFQMNSPEKICVVWLHNVFPLEDTPFALPLEDIQMNITLNGDPGRYYLIAAEESREKEEIKSKTVEHLEYICSPERLIDQLEEVKRLLETHNPSENLFKSVMNKRKRNELYSELCRRIDLIKSCKTIYAEEFMKYYSEAMDLIRNITELL